MKKAALTTMALLMTSGCVDKEVEFTLSCDTVTCPNADDSSFFASGSYRSFTCIWHCASYRGNDNVYVSLDFVSYDGACYALDNEYISSGICQ